MNENARQESHYIYRVMKGEKMGEWYWIKLEKWVWARSCRTLESMVVIWRPYYMDNIYLIRSFKQGN